MKITKKDYKTTAERSIKLKADNTNEQHCTHNTVVSGATARNCAERYISKSNQTV